MSVITDRETEAQELFREVTAGTSLYKIQSSSKKKQEGLRDKFVRLEKLKKTEQAKWWDSATLKQYVKLNRIPRGLRLQVFPT